MRSLGVATSKEMCSVRCACVFVAGDCNNNNNNYTCITNTAVLLRFEVHASSRICTGSMQSANYDGRRLSTTMANAVHHHVCVRPSNAVELASPLASRIALPSSIVVLHSSFASDECRSEEHTSELQSLIRI